MRAGVVMREIPGGEEEPEEWKVECVKAQYSWWPARRQMGPRDHGEGFSCLGGGEGSVGSWWVNEDGSCS